MDTGQRTARIFGALYLITFVTSIPAVLLYQPVLDDPAGYIAGAGHDSRIFLGVLLELLLIIANVGTAVVLVPLFRRQYQAWSIGYVTARIIECTFIAVGIICVLGIVSLRQDGAADGQLAVSLAALKDWTFLLGPGFIVGWGNGLILGYLMYRSGLMPQRLALLGLVGGPLIILSGTLVLFGVFEPGGSVQGLATLPEFVWELALGIYPLVWGFRASTMATTERAEGVPAAAPA